MTINELEKSLSSLSILEQSPLDFSEPDSALAGLNSHFSVTTSNSWSQAGQPHILEGMQELSTPSQISGLYSASSNRVSQAGTSHAALHLSQVAPLPRHISEHACDECNGDDPRVFPFVSDVAPLAIIMFLEAIQHHKELSFNPMTPAYISNRPEYLSRGTSFQVTRVPWQQVRADTKGRIVNDAAYKRLNRSASRGAWLSYLKDLVVTHHMTYHVPDAHKRNVVRLIGLGWESVIDEFLDEPTLAPVIAFEYASYGTLQDLFYSSSLLPTYRHQLRLLSDIAEGLHALHFSNIIHGDVKPENILICKDGARDVIAKLSDFGLSIIDPDSGPAMQLMPGCTERYAAPEVKRLIARDQLKYTDVYSFGIVAWQTLLGGTRPFFSQRYKHGEELLLEEVEDLKTGKHTELANLYSIRVEADQFWLLNRGEELKQRNYEPPQDPVNALLVAMATDSLSDMTYTAGDDGESKSIPTSELASLLSMLQISLSSSPIHRRLESILILLG